MPALPHFAHAPDELISIQSTMPAAGDTPGAEVSIGSDHHQGTSTYHYDAALGR
jgi:hypothetical protein